MARKPWLSASGDYYEKQRERVRVRDNFTCQFCNKHLFIPNASLYDPKIYETWIGYWQRLTLTSVEDYCTTRLPQDRGRDVQVHHIIPRTCFMPHQIEGHDLSNLVTICKAHHAQIHPHLQHNEDRLPESIDSDSRFMKWVQQ